MSKFDKSQYVQSVADMSDDETGEEYLLQKDLSESSKVALDVLKDDLTERFLDHGSEKGKHLMIATNNYEMVREKRETPSVDTEAALALLKKKKLTAYVDSESLISVRKGYSKDDIPKTLLVEMEKFFDFEVRKSVSIDSLKVLLSDGKIAQKDYDAAVKTKEAFSIKVKKI